MANKRWAGRTVSSARAYWKPRLPLPCYQCGRTVSGIEAWVVEHIIPRAHGGDATQRSNQWVSHRTCSDKSGGKISARMTNARRPQTIERMASNRARGIRGI